MNVDIQNITFQLRRIKNIRTLDMQNARMQVIATKQTYFRLRIFLFLEMCSLNSQIFAFIISIGIKSKRCDVVRKTDRTKNKGRERNNICQLL